MTRPCCVEAWPCELASPVLRTPCFRQCVVHICISVMLFTCEVFCASLFFQPKVNMKEGSLCKPGSGIWLLKAWPSILLKEKLAAERKACGHPYSLKHAKTRRSANWNVCSFAKLQDSLQPCNRKLTNFSDKLMWLRFVFWACRII